MVNHLAIAGLAIGVGGRGVLGAKLRPDWGRTQLNPERFMGPLSPASANNRGAEPPISRLCPIEAFHWNRD